MIKNDLNKNGQIRRRRQTRLNKSFWIKIILIEMARLEEEDKNVLIKVSE